MAQPHKCKSDTRDLTEEVLELVSQILSGDTPPMYFGVDCGNLVKRLTVVSKFENLVAEDRVGGDVTSALGRHGISLLHAENVVAALSFAQQTVGSLCKVWSSLGHRWPELELQLFPVSSLHAFSLRIAVYALFGWATAWLKFHFASLTARLMCDPDLLELPTRPVFVPDRENPGMFLSGGGYAELRKLFKLRGAERRLAAWSLMQSKCVFPRPTDQMVAESVYKTYAHLTSTHKEVKPEHWKDCVRRTVDEIFGEGSKCRKRYGPLGQYEKLPSRSAGFGKTRTKGGNFEYLKPIAQRVWLEILEEEKREAPDQLDPELVKLAREAFMSEVWRIAVEEDIAAGGAGEAVAKVRMVGLKEAFKVRTISAGPSAAYFAAQHLWADVWGILRQDPRFSLIGGANLTELLSNGLWRAGRQLETMSAKREFGKPPRELLYVSGDYAAATDNLDREVSNFILEEVSRRLGWNENQWDLAKVCLTQHEMHLPKDAVLWGELNELPTDPKTQKWGQLMGSPISFPILCIANAVSVRMAFEAEYEGCIPLRHLPFLVNGDDLAMYAPREVISRWEHIAHSFGLQKSVGKNYVARDWIVINSALFEVTAHPARLAEQNRERPPLMRERIDIPWRILFAAESRSAVGRDWDPVDGKTELWEGHMDLAECADYALSAFPPSAHEWVTNTMTRSRFDLLSSRYPRGSWGLPRFAGGPGLTGCKLENADRLVMSAAIESFVVGSGKKEYRNVAQLSDRLMRINRTPFGDRVTELLKLKGTVVEGTRQRYYYPRSARNRGAVPFEEGFRTLAEWQAYFEGNNDLTSPSEGQVRGKVQAALYRSLLEVASKQQLAPMVESSKWFRGAVVTTGLALDVGEDPQLDIIERPRLGSQRPAQDTRVHAHSGDRPLKFEPVVGPHVISDRGPGGGSRFRA